ncbi:late competence development ComFB family protein [Aminipila butyrica]|uniref:Late competence development ComFB family protein n=1 Tax=Aminipila butyrica TaxID=433296 RepID=A0A858BT86_9FIRM|nr:late competence development ComFB family protein [Aminipila butyrica]QIB68409.1 late competence development ComFB family protein [Aminipila butyrica]
MAKKSNKTAHVLSLLTNGTSDLTEEERPLDKEPLPVEQRTTAEPPKAEPPKKEVLVQLPGSEEEDLLSDLIKDDLQKELDKQIRSKQDLLHSQEEDSNPHQRPPYSPTFMAMFGQHTVPAFPTEKNSPGQNPAAKEVPHNSESEQTKRGAEQTDQGQPSRKRVESESPVSLNQVKSEPYVLEDFDAENERPSQKTSSEPLRTRVASSSAGFGSIDRQATNTEAKATAAYQKLGIQAPSGQPNQQAPCNAAAYGQATYGRLNRVLHNFAEDILLAQAPPIMQSFNMCICQDCLYDVVAMALNNIKPLYFMVPPEQFAAKLTACQEQYSEGLNSELAKACIKVKLDPSHPRHPAPPR